MPKDKDKKAKKGSAGSAQFEFDPSIYIRQAVDLGKEPAGEHQQEPVLMGLVANIESLFSEWDITDEQWSEPIPAEKLISIQYPDNLDIEGSTTIAEYFKLQPMDTTAVDAKGKKKEKKPTATAAVDSNAAAVAIERLVDELGNPLPVMFKSSTTATTVAATTVAVTTVQGEAPAPTTADDKLKTAATAAEEKEEEEEEHRGFKLLRGFQRLKTAAQQQLEEAAAAVAALVKRAAAEPENAELPAAVAAAKKQLEALTAATTTATTANQSKEQSQQQQQQQQQSEFPSNAVEIDQNICNAYRTLASFVPVVVNHQIDATTTPSFSPSPSHCESAAANFAAAESHVRNELSENYLWRSIYPKLPTGKPYLNPSGKYCVKLYLAGKWRKVYVDDCIPLRADGLPALASSDDRYELWPIILTKAIYTVYSACGYSKRMADVLEPVNLECRRGPYNHPISHKVSHFVAFVVHLMTGWQPHNPVSVRRLFINHPAKSAKLLQSIIAEGISNIDEDDVVLEGIDYPWNVTDTTTVATAAATLDDDDVELALDEDGNITRVTSDAFEYSASSGAISSEFSSFASTTATDNAPSTDEADGDVMYNTTLNVTQSASYVEENDDNFYNFDEQEQQQQQQQQEEEELQRNFRRVGFGDDTVFELGAESAESDFVSDDAADIPQRQQQQPQQQQQREYSYDEADYDLTGDDSAVAAAASAADIFFDADGKLLQTKATFKAEYQKRRDFYDSIVAAVEEREEKLSKIDSMLGQTLTEVFVLVLTTAASNNNNNNNNSDRVVTHVAPILGVCYCKEQPHNLLRARLLVRWEKSPPQQLQLSLNPTPLDPISQRVSGVEFGVLPSTTPLKQKWFTIRQLVLSDAFIVGIDTQMLTPFEHSVCHHWVPIKDNDSTIATTTAAAASGKGKATPAVKGKAADGVADTAELAKPLYFKDPGASPITLLKLDTTQFYSDDAPFIRSPLQQQQQQRGDSSGNLQGALAAVAANTIGSFKLARSPVKAAKRKFMRQGSSAEAEALLLESMQQENELAHPSGLLRRASTNQHHHLAKAEFLHFTLMIHADVVLKYVEPREAAEESTAAAGTTATAAAKTTAAAADDDCSVVTAATTDEHKKLPSDVVLVLQELRFDDVDPLIFVMQMKDNVYLPMVTKSFAISAKRLPKNPTEPLLFWMRLFTRTSVYVHCSSEVAVTIGEAEQLWRDLGKHVYSKSGHLGFTRPQTQQLLFRLPLVIDANAGDDNSTIPGCVDVDDDLSVTSNNTMTPTATDTTAASGTYTGTDNAATGNPAGTGRGIAEEDEDYDNFDEAEQTAAVAEAEDTVKPLISLAAQQKLAAGSSRGPGLAAALSAVEKASAHRACIAFLYVSNRAIERNLTMAVLGNDSSNINNYKKNSNNSNNNSSSSSSSTQVVAPFPRIQGNIIYLSKDPATAATLLGRIFPAYVEGVAEAAVGVPAFDWKLIILSNAAIAETPKSIASAAVSQRFEGRYVANSKLLLFRDVFTIDKYSFPLGIRLTMAQRPAATTTAAAATTTETTADVVEKSEEEKKLLKLLPPSLKKMLQAPRRSSSQRGISVCLRLYRLPDMQLVQEYKGTDTVLCYDQPLLPFLPDGETYDVAAATAKLAEEAAVAAATAAGGKDKGSKKPPTATTTAAAAGDVSSSVKVLLECAVDDYNMNVPADWKSRYPHIFDQLQQQQAAGSQQQREIQQRQVQCLSAAPPADWKFSWRLDILAGSVLEAAHDSSKIQQQLAAKNAWSEQEGAVRTERRDSALKYFKERREKEAVMQRNKCNGLRIRNTAMVESSSASVGSAVVTSNTTAAANVTTEASAVTQLYPAGLTSEAVVQRSTSATTAATTAVALSSNSSDSSSSSSSVTAAAAAVMAPLSQSMIQQLVVALQADAALLSTRYTRLHSLPKYLDMVDILHQQECEDSLIREKSRNPSSNNSAEIALKRKAQFDKEKADLEVRFQDISSRFLQLNTKLREETKERVEQLLQQSSDDATALAQQWQPRQQFREFAAARNESLLALLQRAAEAKAAALRAEEKAAEEAAKLAEKLRKEEEKKAKKKK